ncbi:MAG: hypothetical protein GX174_12815 [Lentisphaerae bacterium]|nr:hypothetical protein [Lentisphaerota bacterium]
MNLRRCLLHAAAVQTVSREREAGTLDTAVPGGMFATPCALQYTAETAGFRAHLE